MKTSTTTILEGFQEVIILDIDIRCKTSSL